MTQAEFSKEAHAWAVEVEHAALDLFNGGAHPGDCLALAIQIVNSRRKATTIGRASLAVPAGVQIPRA